MIEYTVTITWNDGTTAPMDVDAQCATDAEREVMRMLREDDIDEGVVSVRAAPAHAPRAMSMFDLDVMLGNERVPEGWAFA